jgi:hypothetical protein
MQAMQRPVWFISFLLALALALAACGPAGGSAAPGASAAPAASAAPGASAAPSVGGGY